MEAKDFLKWLAIVMVGLWFLWFFTGGPERGISRGGVYIEPANPVGDTWRAYGGEGFSFFNFGSSSNSPDSSDSTTEEEFEKAQELAGISIYKDKVFLKSGNAKTNDVDKEYLKITSSRLNSDRVGLTGWTIESVSTGKKITLDEISYLPYTSKVNPQQAIFIYPGDTVFVITGRSPIGTSFRENLCTGYFEQFQDFYPSLKRSCPRPEDEPDFVRYGTVSMSDKCIDYVEDINRCKIVTETLPINLENECMDYINTKINYNTCVDKHKEDDGFYFSQWRVFLNRDLELWKQKRENLRLLDAGGKLVDTLSY